MPMAFLLPVAVPQDPGVRRDIEEPALRGRKPRETARPAPGIHGHQVPVPQPALGYVVGGFHVSSVQGQIAKIAKIQELPGMTRSESPDFLAILAIPAFLAIPYGRVLNCRPCADSHTRKARRETCRTNG